MKAIDFTPIFKKYRGLWVALTEDQRKVIAAGKRAKDALEKAQKKGITRPILLRVPTEMIYYVGLCKTNGKS